MVIPTMLRDVSWRIAFTCRDESDVVPQFQQSA